MNCTRTIMRELFKVSDGLTLPVGSRIRFPAESSHRDPALQDRQQATHRL